MKFSQQIVRGIPGMVSLTTACLDWNRNTQVETQVAMARMFEISKPCWLHDDLHDTLIRYEGAVNEVEGAGNDSDEALEELGEARRALLTLLRRVL